MPKPPRQSDPFPVSIRPQLVSLVSSPPPGDWSYENKHDGYRMLARIDHGSVKLFTRNGHDWSTRMRHLVAELATLGVTTAWLDGEVVIQDEIGRPDFSAIQRAFSTGRTEKLVFFAFDVMHLDGVDLRQEPVEQRRARLRGIIDSNALEHIRFSEAFAADPRDLLASVCAMEMEGIVGKRAGSPYRSKRSGDWIKMKCQNRQEFIIVGFTKASGGIGSLLLGLHDDDGRLLYAGRVQSGFTSASQASLYAQLAELVISDPDSSWPAPTLPGLRKGRVYWVDPVLVCEVRFAEITPNGKVRHGVFLGMREDKRAEDISLESSAPADPPEPSE